MRRVAGRSSRRADPERNDRRYPERLRHFPSSGSSEAFRGHGAFVPVESTPGRCDMRTALSARRFPDTIIRRRTSRGSLCTLGQFVPGAMVSLELAANVQPILLEDSDFAGGAQLRSLVKAYVPQSADPNASPLTPILAAAFDTSEADEVLWAGMIYTVEETRAWPKFTRAILIRES